MLAILVYCFLFCINSKLQIYLSNKLHFFRIFTQIYISTRMLTLLGEKKLYFAIHWKVHYFFKYLNHLVVSVTLFSRWNKYYEYPTWKKEWTWPLKVKAWCPSTRKFSLIWWAKVKTSEFYISVKFHPMRTCFRGMGPIIPESLTSICVQILIPKKPQYHAGK